MNFAFRVKGVQGMTVPRDLARFKRSLDRDRFNYSERIIDGATLFIVPNGDRSYVALTNPGRNVVFADLDALDPVKAAQREIAKAWRWLAAGGGTRTARSRSGAWQFALKGRPGEGVELSAQSGEIWVSLGIFATPNEALSEANSRCSGSLVLE